VDVRQRAARAGRLDRSVGAGRAQTGRWLVAWTVLVILAAGLSELMAGWG
jgi:hypothetical protein